MDNERAPSHPGRVGPKKRRKRVKKVERGHQGQGLWGHHIGQDSEFPLHFIPVSLVIWARADSEQGGKQGMRSQCR